MAESSEMPKLANRDICTGCSACASICPKKCITMVKDEFGFAYPEITEQNNCIHCKVCENICPVLNKLYAAQNGPKAYAAYSKDKEARMKSSSGGVFTEIAEYVLNQGGVVYGAAYDKNFIVNHIKVEKIEDLDMIRRAKYSESWLGNTFNSVKEYLKSGKVVLFAGTPCQAAGLKAFLGKDYVNLLTVDFICHGIPSPMVWNRYISYRAQKDNEGSIPLTINQRSKSTGWSRYQYSVEFKYSGNQAYSALSAEDSYMRLFTRDYISRLSCSNCHFKGYSRVSDITLGDFWGIWDILPEVDCDQGISAILVQTQKMDKLLEVLSERIKVLPVECEQISLKNKYIIESAKLNPERESLLKSIKNKGFESGECIAAKPKKNIFQSLKRKMKKMVSK